MNNMSPVPFQILEVIEMQRKNCSLKTSSKSCHVISCRIHGESTIFFNNKKHTIRKGDILYIPFGACYSQECREEELIAFHLNISGNSPAEPSDEIRIISPKDPEKICDLFRSAAAHWRTQEPGYQYFCMSDLCRILGLTAPEILSDTSPEDPVISPSLNYLKSHLFDTDLSLDTVYRQSFVSQTSFIRHFRQLYGCSPVKYVNRQRIQKAKTLLKSHLYTREEIAYLCGYANVKHFYVVFRQLTGMTCGEYLKTKETENDVFSHT